MDNQFLSIVVQRSKQSIMLHVVSLDMASYSAQLIHFTFESDLSQSDMDNLYNTQLSLNFVKLQDINENYFETTEHAEITCTCFGDICFCYSQTGLPGPAWVILSKVRLPLLESQFSTATCSRLIVQSRAQNMALVSNAAKNYRNKICAFEVFLPRFEPHATSISCILCPCSK